MDNIRPRKKVSKHKTINVIRTHSDAVNIKEDKLKAFAHSILDNPTYHNELSQLLNVLGLKQQSVISSYVNYDLDIFSYDNDIYSPLVMRMVLHLHNLLEGSWHQERQKIINNMICELPIKNMIDIGFGLPTQYLKTALAHRKFHITLNDYAASAFVFAEALLTLWDKNWKKIITFNNTDMRHISQVEPEAYDLLLFQDSIEHIPNPLACLRKYVKHSSPHAFFLLSLPIGPITPIHYIEWQNNNDAITWLHQCGLRIISFDEVYVNPEVDLFAEQLHYNYYNFIALCIKDKDY